MLRSPVLFSLLAACIAGALLASPIAASAQRIVVHDQDEPAKQQDVERSRQEAEGRTSDDEGGSVHIGLSADEHGARIVVHDGAEGDTASFHFDADFGDTGRKPRDARPGWDDDDYRFGDQGDDRVAIGSDLHIPAGKTIDGDAVAIMGSVYIDGVVHGQVVSIGGSVEIGPEARVGGEAVCIGGGDVLIATGAIVRGEVVAVGGQIKQEEGSLIGERIEVSFIPSFGLGGGLAGLTMVLHLGELLFVAIAGLILLQISRRRWEISSAILRSRGWESLLAGIGGGIVYIILILPLLAVAMVALVAIVVGIPLVPVVALLLLLFPVPGYLIAGTLLGLTVMGRTQELDGVIDLDAPEPPRPNLPGLGRAFLLGHLLLSLPALMGLLLGLAGVAGVVVGVFLMIGWGVVVLAIALGWGAFLLSRFGRRAPARVVLPPADPALARS